MKESCSAVFIVAITITILPVIMVVLPLWPIPFTMLLDEALTLQGLNYCSRFKLVFLLDHISSFHPAPNHGYQKPLAQNTGKMRNLQSIPLPSFFFFFFFFFSFVALLLNSGPTS
jgi:hypothetical protein